MESCLRQAGALGKSLSSRSHFLHLGKGAGGPSDLVLQLKYLSTRRGLRRLICIIKASPDASMTALRNPGVFNCMTIGNRKMTGDGGKNTLKDTGNTAQVGERDSPDVAFQSPPPS